MIAGIEQKDFYPVAKNIIAEGKTLYTYEKYSKKEITKKTKNEKPQISPKKETVSKKTFATPLKTIKNSEKKERSDKTTTESRKGKKDNYPRFLIERRRVLNRRYNNDQRQLNDRRIKQDLDYDKEEKRKLTIRRKGIERRENSNRRLKNERRSENIKIPVQDSSNISKTSYNKHIKSRFLNNTYLHLNGITQAMTFVHTGDIVTFMQARLGYQGFKILRLQKFNLPFEKNNQTIKNLPELINNVYNQFISQKNQKKLYLAIHSDGYHYEMTYVNVKENKKQFREFLNEVMEKSYGLKKGKSYSTFNFNYKQENSAVICYSKNKDIITRDYEILLDAGYSQDTIPLFLL